MRLEKRIARPNQPRVTPPAEKPAIPVVETVETSKPVVEATVEVAPPSPNIVEPIPAPAILETLVGASESTQSAPPAPRVSALTDDAIILNPSERAFINFWRECESKNEAVRMCDGPPRILSILICTMTSRADMLARLRSRLDPQVAQFAESVEILEELDDGTMPVGMKRNRLVRRALGEYTVFIDDDDLPSPDYVRKIMEAINATPRPDVVGIRGVMVVLDGNRVERKRSFEHTIRHDRWYVNGGHYYRCPCHLNPVRREIALRVPFRNDITFEEDFLQSLDMRGQLKVESMIEGPIYLYELRPK